MSKFWKWKKNIINQDSKESLIEEILFLNGTIAEESWFDDEITPKIFSSELKEHRGDITVWINSPGGDCIAAAQIYNMLKEHKGKITVKIDGIAASAASVIAMAGDEIYMSPVSMMMIHNPATIAFGDRYEMKKAADMLDEIKESIINAYETKSSLGRNKISKLMDEETWMNANKALELGFITGILNRVDLEDIEQPQISNVYSEVLVMNSLIEKVAKKCKTNTGVKAEKLFERLNLIKTWR